jgi:tetratricopeptide (TPR) repeat protein
MTSLATLFMVAGLCLYVVGRMQMLRGRSGLSIILVGLFCLGGLAILSKENGILLPLYMLVIEFTVFRFQGANQNPDKSIITLFTLILAIPALFALLYLVTHTDSMLNYSHRDFTLWERVLTEPRVLIFYLKMIIMPSVQELGLYHDDFSLSHGLLSPFSTLPAILAIAGLLTAGLLLRTLRPLVSLGILWFFTGHVLESTILPLELAHEHRNYLADYGILLAATCAVAQAPLKKLMPWISVPVPLLLILVFSYTTWLRSEQWSDNINHAIYEARHHPQSHRAVFSAGRIHGRLALEGRVESKAEAFRYLERSMQLDKTGVMSNVTLIKLSYLLDEPENPAWFDDMLDKLSRYPISAADISSLQALSDCTEDICRIEPERMEALFAIVLQKPDAKLVSAYGYYTINTRGNFNKGLTLFRQAVELNPREPQYRKNLINLLLYMQKFDEAEQELEAFRQADTYGNSRNFFDSVESELNTLQNGTIPPPNS